MKETRRQQTRPKAYAMGTSVDEPEASCGQPAQAQRTCFLQRRYDAQNITPGKGLNPPCLAFQSSYRRTSPKVAVESSRVEVGSIVKSQEPRIR